MPLTELWKRDNKGGRDMAELDATPIGLPPEKFWIEERLHKLDAAIRKRRDTPEHPPCPEWYEEYYRHMTWLIACENAEKESTVEGRG